MQFLVNQQKSNGVLALAQACRGKVLVQNKKSYYLHFAVFFFVLVLLYLFLVGALIGWSMYIGGEDGHAFFAANVSKYCSPLYHYYIERQGEGIVLDFFWLLGNGWSKLFQAISYLFNLI